MRIMRNTHSLCLLYFVRNISNEIKSRAHYSEHAPRSLYLISQYHICQICVPSVSFFKLQASADGWGDGGGGGGGIVVVLERAERGHNGYFI